MQYIEMLIDRNSEGDMYIFLVERGVFVQNPVMMFFDMIA